MAFAWTFLFHAESAEFEITQRTQRGFKACVQGFSIRPDEKSGHSNRPASGRELTAFAVTDRSWVRLPRGSHRVAEPAERIEMVCGALFSVEQLPLRGRIFFTQRAQREKTRRERREASRRTCKGYRYGRAGVPHASHSNRPNVGGPTAWILSGSACLRLPCRHQYVKSRIAP